MPPRADLKKIKAGPALPDQREKVTGDLGSRVFAPGDCQLNLHSIVSYGVGLCHLAQRFYEVFRESRLAELLAVGDFQVNRYGNKILFHVVKC